MIFCCRRRSRFFCKAAIPANRPDTEEGKKRRRELRNTNGKGNGKCALFPCFSIGPSVISSGWLTYLRGRVHVLHLTVDYCSKAPLKRRITQQQPASPSFSGFPETIFLRGADAEPKEEGRKVRVTGVDKTGAARSHALCIIYATYPRLSSSIPLSP